MRRTLVWLAVTCGATACGGTDPAPARVAAVEPSRPAAAVAARVRPALPPDMVLMENDDPVDHEADRDEIVAVDRDSDDLPDEEDRCPDLPEDRDEFADVDGCPEPATGD